MRRFLLLFLVILPFLFTTQANASEDWVINRFQSNITLQQNGKVKIVETIDVDFGMFEKHGIFRDIPYVYQNEDGSRRYTEIEVEDLTIGGLSVPYSLSKTGGYVEIKIGDADKLVTGKQIYKIEYLAEGILNSFEDYDELYWNATGDQWQVPIEKAQTKVTLPTEAIKQIVCFEGSRGSTDACQKVEVSKKEASFESTRSYAAAEGLTIVVGYTKGLVPIITVAAPKSVWDNLFSLTNLIAFVASLGIGLSFVYWIWVAHGRDFWWRRRFLYDPEAKEELRPIGAHDTIVVEYDPPDKLRPAEIGTLIDERADTLDVTSTIVDLAARGYLNITEDKKKWLFGKTDYILAKTDKGAQDLLEYERKLLERIFEEGDVVSISSLKTKFYKDLKVVKEKLYQDVIDKKYFSEDPEKVRLKYLGLGFGVMFLGGLLGFAAFATGLNLFLSIGAGVVISGLSLAVFSQFMPRKTAVGREMWRRAKGYELFISKAEKYRQQFFERKNMFNEILPYAIMFGLTEKFAQAFKDMGIEPPQPTWYTGTAPFNPVLFGAGISAFSTSLSSAMASAPGGSGFSSGGGSSGGGFGGGGGGSW